MRIRKTLLFDLPDKFFRLKSTVSFSLGYALFKFHNHPDLIQEPWVYLSQFVYLFHRHVHDERSSQIEYFLTSNHRQIFLYLLSHPAVNVIKERMNRRFLKTAATYFQRP